LTLHLVTLGKIVGGGLPVGVFGGKRVSWTNSRRSAPFTRLEPSAESAGHGAGIATVSYLQEHAAQVYPQP